MLLDFFQGHVLAPSSGAAAAATEKDILVLTGTGLVSLPAANNPITFDTTIRNVGGITVLTDNTIRLPAGKNYELLAKIRLQAASGTNGNTKLKWRNITDNVDGDMPAFIQAERRTVNASDQDMPWTRIFTTQVTDFQLWPFDIIELTTYNSDLSRIVVREV